MLYCIGRTLLASGDFFLACALCNALVKFVLALGEHAKEAKVCPPPKKVMNLEVGPYPQPR